MKKIRTNDGILFLDEEDYMPRLLAYLRDTAGEDAAALVEEWAKSEQDKYVEAMARAEAQAAEATARALRLFDEMRDERDEHIEEISELEDELTALAEFKDKLLDANEYMTGLINNPEKLFPAIGTAVYRDTKDGKHDDGRIEMYKLRLHNGAPEFFVKVRWKYAGASWSKFSNIGKTISIFNEEDVRV